MSTIEEFKIIRLYRAFNTVIQLCQDRGYVIRHPSSVAEALTQPEFYTPGEGLDYDWFLAHFVLTPEAARQSLREGSAAAEEESEAEHQEQVEMRRRAMKGEWIAMRNAMRLTCAASTSSSNSASGGGNSTSAEGGGSASASPGGRHSEGGAEKRREQILVFFSGSPALSVKEVQDYREKALKKKASRMIVVAAGRVGPAVLRDVRELSGHLNAETQRELLRIQVLEEDALGFNVATHETVPRHVVLSESEARRFLTERHLNLSQLPRMLESDPMVQYLDLHRGDIVKIIRESKESGPYDMYRQVI